jgi:hypothetical protein
VVLASSSALPSDSSELPSTDISRDTYERAIKSHHKSQSSLPSQGEAELLLQLDQSMFTDDAWEGMKT